VMREYSNSSPDLGPLGSGQMGRRTTPARTSPRSNENFWMAGLGSEERAPNAAVTPKARIHRFPEDRTVARALASVTAGDRTPMIGRELLPRWSRFSEDPCRYPLCSVALHRGSDVSVDLTCHVGARVVEAFRDDLDVDALVETGNERCSNRVE
jgi:hypothetical protein